MLFLILFNTLVYAQSFGDGSDGVCNFTAGSPLVKNTYNCTDIIISGAGNIEVVDKSQSLVLYSQGTVNIQPGANLSVSANGNVPGPGGVTGGVCVSTLCSAVSGSGSGAGAGGTNGTEAISLTGAGGGGGAGGSYGSSGQNGFSAGSDGNPGLGGLVSNPYGAESSFLFTIPSGSGGGAGGSGEDDSSATISSGDGGASGGVISIIAQGDIIVDGKILATGGDGQNGIDGTFSGGSGAAGGGGSGGSIFFYSKGLIIISGEVSAKGGVGGIGGINSSRPTTSSGNGGNGGLGRIRFDSSTGSYQSSGSSVVSPIPYEQSSIPSVDYTSDLKTGCVTSKSVSIDYYILSFLLGFIFFIRRHKHE